MKVKAGAPPIGGTHPLVATCGARPVVRPLRHRDHRPGVARSHECREGATRIYRADPETQTSEAGVGLLRRSDVQCAESAHISARLLAKKLQAAPVAESPLPREGRPRAPAPRGTPEHESGSAAGGILFGVGGVILRQSPATRPRTRRSPARSRSALPRASGPVARAAWRAGARPPVSGTRA